MSRESSRLPHVILLLILVGAALLRGLDLQALGLWIDEDLTRIVVSQIRDSGWARLPSGEAYNRGALYHYIVAAFTVFGDGEVQLRLPSLIFSLGTVLVGYAYGRALAGPGAGLLAAAILGFSPWEHHYARMARMYALLGLLVISAAYLTHRGWYLGERRSRVGAALLAILAVPVHQIGAILALGYWLPHAKQIRPRLLQATLWATLAMVAARWGFKWFKRFHKSLTEDRMKLVVEAGSESSGMDLPFLPSMTFNHSRFLLGDFAEEKLWVAAVVLAIFVAAALVLLVGLRPFLRRASRDAEPGFGLASAELTSVPARRVVGSIEWLVTLLCALGFLFFLFVNQLVLAALLGLVLWIRSREIGLVRLLIISGALSVVAVFLGQMLVHGPGSIGERSFLRLFFALPVPFYRLFALHYPLMVLVSVVGFGIYFRRSFRRADDGRLFLGSLVFAFLFLMGLFASPYVIDRYTFFINGVSVVFFSVVVADLARFVSDRWEGRFPASASASGSESPPKSASKSAASEVPASGSVFARRAFPVICLVGLLVSGQFDPLQAYRATRVTTGFGQETLDDPDLVSHYRYDWRGTAEFLRTHIGPDDLLVAKDPVELWAYGVKSDARINNLHSVYGRLGEEEVRDWYLRIPVFYKQSQLVAYLDQARAAGKRVWIVYPREIQDGPAVHLPPEMKTFLAAEPGEILNSRDGVTRVIRIDPD